MICNKKEWEILDNVQATLLKFAPMMDERDKARANALIYLCAESTKAEKARNEKSAQRIKERRKENPDYAECLLTSFDEMLELLYETKTKIKKYSKK